MKVLFLADARNAHTIRWVTALGERGLDVLLFSLQSANPRDFAAARGVRVETHGLSAGTIRGGHTSVGKLRYLTAVPRIRAIAEAFRPDVCNAHFATSYGLLATMARLDPLVVSVWGTDVYDAPRQNPFLRAALKSVLRRADCVASTSDVMAAVTRVLVDRPITVTPFGVDTDRFSPMSRAPAARKVQQIGVVKALEAKYGIDVLIRAFEKVVSERPRNSVQLVIVGEGSCRRQLERLVEALNLNEYVRFVGRVAYSEVHLLHQSFDLAVYPSIDPSESFGVSAVESQACGVPVIASDIGGLSEVVSDGESGLLVQPGDTIGLARAICRLLQDDALRGKLGIGARNRVLQRFSLEHSVNVMLQLYRTAATVKSQKTGGDHEEC